MRDGRSPPLTPNRLIVCILINQLATPGLGSLMARQMVAGAGQLLLALAGFGLIVTWMCDFFYRSIKQALGEPSSQSTHGWALNWGFILFGASWLWALVTSVSLGIKARKLARAAKESVPPRITN